MVTAREAYELFVNKFPEATGRQMHEYKDFYTIEKNTVHEIDFVDDCWKIDKKTGEIEEFRISDYIEQVKPGEWVKSYWVSLPTYTVTFLNALVNHYSAEGE